MKDKSFQWGILGCGDVTEIKSGPGLRKASGSSVVACMRRDAKKAEDYAQRHDIPTWYDNADNLIDDPLVQGVYIATSPESHKEYTLKVAKAGKPVYVEKPPAMNSAELYEMIEACKDHDVPLFVAYYRRGLPLFAKIKALIEEGKIGTPRSMILSIRESLPKDIDTHLPWRLNPEIAGGGLFMDLGCHQLDILDWILGPIKNPRGFAVNRAGKYKAEDGVATSFEFESGVIGTGLWDFTVADEVKEDRVEIIGDRGRLEFAVFAHQHLIYEGQEGRQEWDLPNPEHVQQPLIQTIADQLNGSGQCPSTGETALRTSLVIDSLLEDYYS
ncbi:Gfo/Idh/MocA family protein [Psychromonas sp. KJ10-10]|uniref:Gfo/Idh/MocA family protein n=1 Tax=Psychromonas sp. KJ10-10 TaxID=3391823 RepID=UPI0039B378A0